MVNLKIKVNTKEEKADAILETEGASLADLAIAERMLRRYLRKIIVITDRLLDKDTDTNKSKKMNEGIDTLRLRNNTDDQLLDDDT